MHRFAPLLALTGLLAAAPAFAAPSTQSPLIGRWSLDVTTLPMPAAVRPQRVDLEFRPAANHQWTTKVDIVDQAGGKMHSESTLALDGTPGRATGTYWVDVLAAHMPKPDVLVMQFVYEKIPRSTRVYTVSDDGKVLTETETYFTSDGTPKMRIAHFSRAAAAP